MKIRTLEDLRDLEKKGYSLQEQWEALLASSELLTLLENNPRNLIRFDNSWEKKIQTLLHEGLHPWFIANRKVAFIACVHANLEALKAVWEDIEKQKIQEVFCLGGMIGYGPNPSECVEFLFGHCKVLISGRFEETILNRDPLIKPYLSLGPSFKEEMLWVEEQLRPRWFSSSRKKLAWQKFQELSLSYQERGVLAVYGTPQKPILGHFSKSDAEGLFGEVSERIVANFALVEQICFVGNIHFPNVITEKGEYFTPEQLQGRLKIEPHKKYMINVGSVGQPRDKNNKACYVTFDGNEIQWHRISYPYTETMKKIIKNSALNPRNAERLEYGV